MASQKTYLVSFNSAKRTSYGGWAVSFSLVDAPVEHEVTATLTELAAAVTKLAHAYGKPCAASVKLKDRGARNVPGFNKWYYSLKPFDVASEATNEN